MLIDGHHDDGFVVEVELHRLPDVGHRRLQIVEAAVALALVEFAKGFVSWSFPYRS